MHVSSIKLLSPFHGRFKPIIMSISYSSPLVPHPKHRKPIFIWLMILCLMLIGMIALGGATRLTGSGLSIMDWRPVTGMIPPLTHQEWVRQFELYKTIPQYKILHEGFGLAGFQHIFWLEWIHRFWGRLIGIVLIIPLIVFAFKGMVSRTLAFRLFLLFILGGMQGAIGWFMVSSGFDPNSTAVAPVRLVLHLVFALILYALLLWTAFSVRWPKSESPLLQNTHLKNVTFMGWTSLFFLSLTIIAGGFTAGTHAGFSYNEFPFMQGHLIPSSYASLSPFIKNWFQNIAAVQFNHRFLASLTLLWIVTTIIMGLKLHAPRMLHTSLVALGWAVGLQYLLGVTTLLLVVPVWAGTLHQTCAAIVLGGLLFFLYQLHILKKGSLPERKPF